MKKWWVLISVIVVVAISTAYWFNQPKVLNAWSENDEVPIVLQNKTWKLLISTKLDPETVTPTNIYVTNSDGKKQEVSVSLNDQNQSIQIAPPEAGYDLDSEFFTIHLEGKIRSHLGRTIADLEPLRFTVRKTLPVIGSKEKLTEHFLQVLKEEKQQSKRSIFSNSDSDTSAESMSGADSAKADVSGNQNFSETNVQVQGVDEPDLLKNDGTYLYQVIEDSVVITKASPADEMEIVSRIPFSESDFRPFQLLQFNDKLVVIGHSYRNIDTNKRKDLTENNDTLMFPANQTVRSIVYNIKDRSNPILEREIEQEGSYVSARRTNDHVYLVSKHYPDYWNLNEKKTRKIELRPWVRDSSNSEEPKFIEYDQIKYFPGSKETNYTIITSFSIDNPEQSATFTTFLGSGDQLYMSTDNLYIAVNTFTDVSTRPRFSFTPDTSIYKFSINDDEVTFKHFTEVEGSVLNQFSMDEYEGNFRIATTSGDTWNEEEPSSNQLFIFNNDLKQIGKITGLAEGERIYSARFMKDRIYIVTFKQVDPLFVIDASNPRNPVVKGELKIPGFSNYLHPYDEDHIIGFGQNTTLTENTSNSEPIVRTDGIKISLFDVSNMENPIEKFTEIIPGNGTYSPLNHDHKALLFYKKRNFFAFPVHIFDHNEDERFKENFSFQGALVYKLTTEDGFELEQKLTHSSKEGLYPYGEWETEIQRLTYIDNILYTVSHNKIIAHDLDTYEEISELALR